MTVPSPEPTVPTKLVSTTGPLATPEAYVVPGSLEVQLSSVNATYDGTAAGGSFDPTLSVYSKDNKLISRTKVGSTVAAGGSAVCTWIPFSRKPAATPTPGATINALHLYTETAFVVPDSSEKQITFDHVSSFDSTVFGTVTSGGRVTSLSLKKQGCYSCFAEMDWGSSGATQTTWMYNFLLDGQLIEQPMSALLVDLGAINSTQPTYSWTRVFPAIGPAGEVLPTRMRCFVGQNSGLSRTTSLVYWSFMYHGATDF